jgi:hypothetical protein
MSATQESALHAARSGAAAEELLRDARARRWVFPDEKFSGFCATLDLNENGVRRHGSVTLKSVQDIEFDLPGAGAETLAWLKGALAMNVAHRLQRTGGMPVPTTFPVFFDPDAENALGVKITFEGDPLGSSYRIKDGVITEVHRAMHGSLFTITTLEVTAADDGRTMPKHYVVTYFDPETKRVNGVAQYTEGYEKVDGVYLPNSIRVIETVGDRTDVRLVELSNIVLR